MSRFTPIKSRKRALVVTAIALALVAGVSAAFALVKVYSNDFSNSAEADQLGIEGKGCHKVWDEDNKRLVVVADAGPARCRLKIPVQGDAPQPDQAVLVTAKLDKAIANSVAKKTYISVTIRDGAGGYYELRVYPALRRAELHREPDANGFPVAVRDKAIGKPGDRNFIRLEVNGDLIKAKVNKAALDPITDQNASELEGRRITVQLVVDTKTPDPVSGWIDDLQIQIPTP